MGKEVEVVVDEKQTLEKASIFKEDFLSTIKKQ